MQLEMKTLAPRRVFLASKKVPQMWSLPLLICQKAPLTSPQRIKMQLNLKKTQLN